MPVASGRRARKAVPRPRRDQPEGHRRPRRAEMRIGGPRTPRPAVSCWTNSSVPMPAAIEASASGDPGRPRRTGRVDRHATGSRQAASRRWSRPSTTVWSRMARRMPSEPAGDARPGARPAGCGDRRPPDGVEALVEVLRQRGRQHEQDGVAGADLGGEHRGQRERAEVRRQLVEEHRWQGHVRGWRGRGGRREPQCPKQHRQAGGRHRAAACHADAAPDDPLGGCAVRLLHRAPAK